MSIVGERLDELELDHGLNALRQYLEGLHFVFAQGHERAMRSLDQLSQGAYHQPLRLHEELATASTTSSRAFEPAPMRPDCNTTPLGPSTPAPQLAFGGQDAGMDNVVPTSGGVSDTRKIVPVYSSDSNLPRSAPPPDVRASDHEVVDSTQKYKRMCARALFPQQQEIKAIIGDTLQEQELTLASRYYKETGPCAAAARSETFSNISLTMITLNAFWMWVEMDLNRESLSRTPWLFFLVESLFCAYFCVELIIRMLAFESKRDFIKDWWLMFDFLLVTLMVTETWLIPFVLEMLMASDSDLDVMGNASIFRVMRLMRLTRMARMAKLLRAVPELVVLIKGMAVAARCVMYTLVLLMCLIYVFALAFVGLVKGTALEESIFSSVSSSVGFLLLTGTIPDLVDIIRKDIGGVHIVYAILFFFFILLSTVLVMNMLIGVLVNVVSVVALVEREKMDVLFVKSYVSQILDSRKMEKAGFINKAEFELLVQTPGLIKVLQKVGVDVVGLVDYIDFIFREDVALNLYTFTDLVMQLRGENHATVRDLVDMRKFLLEEFFRLENGILRAIGAPERKKPDMPSDLRTFIKGISHHDAAAGKTKPFLS